MRLGAGLFLIIGIAFIIINTKPSRSHARPTAQIAEQQTTISDPKPDIRHVLYPAACTVDEGDLDSIYGHLADGEATQGKQELSALVFNGKARLLDLNESVILLWSSGKIARIQPINPTEEGDRYACYVPTKAIQ